MIDIEFESGRQCVFIEKNDAVHNFLEWFASQNLLSNIADGDDVKLTHRDINRSYKDLSEPDIELLQWLHLIHPNWGPDFSKSPGYHLTVKGKAVLDALEKKDVVQVFRSKLGRTYSIEEKEDRMVIHGIITKWAES